MTIKNQFQQETQGNVLTKLAKNMAAYGGSCTRQTRLGPGSNGTKDAKTQRWRAKSTTSDKFRVAIDWFNTTYLAGRGVPQENVEALQKLHSHGFDLLLLLLSYEGVWCRSHQKTTRLHATGNAHSMQGYTKYIPLEDARHWQMLDHLCCCSQAIRSSTLHAASVQPK